MKEHLSFRHQTRFVVQVDCSVDYLTDTAGTVWSSVILGAYTLLQSGVEIWKCALVFSELFQVCAWWMPASWPLCHLVGRLSERRIRSRKIAQKDKSGLLSQESWQLIQHFSPALTVGVAAVAYSHLTVWVVCSHAWFRFRSSILKPFLICPHNIEYSIPPCVCHCVVQLPVCSVCSGRSCPFKTKECFTVQGGDVARLETRVLNYNIVCAMYYLNWGGLDIHRGEVHVL